MTKPDTGVRIQAFGPFVATVDLLAGWVDVVLADPADAFPFACGRSRLWDVGEVGDAIGSCIGVRDKRVADYLLALRWARDLLRMPEGARIDDRKPAARRARWMKNRLRAYEVAAQKAVAKAAPGVRRRAVRHG